MPTGTTSYRSGSRPPIPPPADTQEIACSALRPPNTTATRTLPAFPLIAADPSRAVPARRSGGVERGREVGDEVSGVLDATGEPDEPRGHRVPAPLRPPVD